jgi:hypothetical protein
MGHGGASPASRTTMRWHGDGSHLIGLKMMTYASNNPGHGSVKVDFAKTIGLLGVY